MKWNEATKALFEDDKDINVPTNKEINMNKIRDSILLDIEESERILQSNQMVYCSDVPWRILYAEARLDVLHKYKQLIEGQNNASV